MDNKRYVLDTSIVIGRQISLKLANNEIRKGSEIIIPVAVLDELQSQASDNKEHGIDGLEEIRKIRELCGSRGVLLHFTGQRPTINDIRLAKRGRIDSIIKDVARENDATLLTADYIQYLVASAQGVNSELLKPSEASTYLTFEKFFDENTMSVHLKDGVAPMAKSGKPGKFQLLQLSEEKMSHARLNEIANEIVDSARMLNQGSIEISRKGAIVVQLGMFRVAITRPPFSESIEITIVRPMVKLSLSDYDLSEKLMHRLSRSAEGIIIAGPPGSGKSTFASSIAEFYARKGKIVKTLESPRDLQVSRDVTQYGPLEGSFEKAVDILLLVRPDYTVFDEVRRTNDFVVFSDMRLAGVGMVGVVHASSPLDAVQRFIGKIELGMIPHILDTIIFVKDGSVNKVYEISLTIRVPTGMTESDLARPVIEVRDFDTRQIEYEIYTYGEENIVIPISGLVESIQSEDAIRRLAESKVRDIIRRFDPSADIRIVSQDKVQIRVNKDIAPVIIGKGGSTVNELEKMLGIHIDVEIKTPTIGQEIPFEVSEGGSSINLLVDPIFIGKKVNVYVQDEFLFNSQVGKKARIKVDKHSENGRRLVNAVVGHQQVKLCQSIG
ncbi:MAG TPA: PINc/VapC family ATPase [Nitrososphaeraceae archaeon]|nr:PINc/VapC family ATPase [Nitrososphaeraceae archaeon]